MIITRTPLRISLGGGGTDLPSYYSQHEGFLVTAAIDKHVYIMVNPRFERSLRISYSQTEIADSVDEVKHPIVREALRFLGLETGLEIVSIADLPANSGLGSSSTFTVGLLHALHVYKREPVTPKQLAEEAFHIEAEVLGEPIGKQDQYAAAYGGIIAMDIDRDGTVDVTRLELPDGLVQDLEHSLTLWYTGLRRAASEVLAGQSKSLSNSTSDPTLAMHEIKQIGFQIRDALAEGEFHRIGELMDVHWENKKRLAGNVSSGTVDRWYAMAKDSGAVGGKIIGAGGGGFFMFYTPSQSKTRLRQSMSGEGLQELRLGFDFDGSKLVANL